MNKPQSGYTLPVFACASAVAALQCLQDNPIDNPVAIDLIQPQQIVKIPVEQFAKISDYSALAITRSQPGDNLDLTRNTPIWAIVEWQNQSDEQIVIEGGEGIGKLIYAHKKPAIYDYAQQLLHFNLSYYLQPQEKIKVTIVLPEGKALALRTSNESFGVAEGLSLLGTTGISQPLSHPQQLENFRQELITKASQFDSFVFCIGENGLDLAPQLGISPARLIKTANWLGPMLVTAALIGIESILLFGYHGKLIKLAGGIFHTHHHLADARLEIFTAHCANLGLNPELISQIFNLKTTDEGLKLLQNLDQETNNSWTDKIYQAIALKIDQRSQEYIYQHTSKKIKIGSILFDRQRQIIVQSNNGGDILSRMI